MSCPNTTNSQNGWSQYIIDDVPQICLSERWKAYQIRAKNITDDSYVVSQLQLSKDYTVPLFCDPFYGAIMTLYYRFISGVTESGSSSRGFVMPVPVLPNLYGCTFNAKAGNLLFYIPNQTTNPDGDKYNDWFFGQASLAQYSSIAHLPLFKLSLDTATYYSKSVASIQGTDTTVGNTPSLFASSTKQTDYPNDLNEFIIFNCQGQAGTTTNSYNTSAYSSFAINFCPGVPLPEPISFQPINKKFNVKGSVFEALFNTKVSNNGGFAYQDFVYEFDSLAGLEYYNQACTWNTKNKSILDPTLDPPILDPIAYFETYTLFAILKALFDSYKLQLKFNRDDKYLYLREILYVSKSSPNATPISLTGTALNKQNSLSISLNYIQPYFGSNGFSSSGDPNPSFDPFYIFNNQMKEKVNNYDFHVYLHPTPVNSGQNVNNIFFLFSKLNLLLSQLDEATATKIFSTAPDSANPSATFYNAYNYLVKTVMSNSSNYSSQSPGYYYPLEWRSESVSFRTTLIRLISVIIFNSSIPLRKTIDRGSNLLASPMNAQMSIYGLYWWPSSDGGRLLYGSSTNLTLYTGTFYDSSFNTEIAVTNQMTQVLAQGKFI